MSETRERRIATYANFSECGGRNDIIQRMRLFKVENPDATESEIMDVVFERLKYWVSFIGDINDYKATQVGYAFSEGSDIGLTIQAKGRGIFYVISSSIILTASFGHDLQVIGMRSIVERDASERLLPRGDLDELGSYTKSRPVDNRDYLTPSMRKISALKDEFKRYTDDLEAYASRDPAGFLSRAEEMCTAPFLSSKSAIGHNFVQKHPRAYDLRFSYSPLRSSDFRHGVSDTGANAFYSGVNIVSDEDGTTEHKEV